MKRRSWHWMPECFLPRGIRARWRIGTGNLPIRIPPGRAFIWIAEYEEQMIAHFAAVPYRLKVFDREVMASHSIGALVEKKYQNRGLLKLVGDELWEELSREGIAFTWGFPNQRAYAFHKAILGYSDLIDFHTWKITKSEMQAFESPTLCRRSRNSMRSLMLCGRTALVVMTSRWSGIAPI